MPSWSGSALKKWGILFVVVGNSNCRQSGVFWIFINHQGKRVSRKVGGKAAAKEVAKKIKAKLILGQDAFPKPEPEPEPKLPTLEDYYEHIKKTYLETATRRTTQRAYETSFKHILSALGTKRIDEITKTDVRTLIASLVQKGQAKASIQICVSHLRSIHAVDDDTYSANPASKCGKYYEQAPVRHEEVQPLNPEEVGLFLATVLNSNRSRQHYALFLAAIHTGMRSAELAGLRWGDIDFNGKFLTVRRSWVSGRIHRTKTSKIRRVDMSDALLEALTELKRQRRREWLKKGVNRIPQWVFANDAGRPPSMANIKNRHFFEALDRAGLRRIRLHDLRHTYASLLLQNGEPIHYVKEMLGHSSIKLTVDTYGHLEPGRNRQAVNKLPTEKDVSAEALEKTGSG